MTAFQLYRPEKDFNRAELIAELAAMPSRLRELIAGASAEALQQRIAGEEWPPIEVLRHVRDVVQVYGVRFKWMILDDDPFLPNYDEDRWVSASRDGPAQVEAMLCEIEAYRGETVRLLSALGPDGWSRTGRHEVLGSVVLESYVAHQVEHERQHLSQLALALRR
jgi:DinB family protein